MNSCVKIEIETFASLAHSLEGSCGVIKDGLFDPENENFRSGAPPDSEIPQHLAVIEEIAGDVKRYDSELDRLRKVVWELESKRNTLQKRLDEHRNLVSVMRRLPVELWDTIFRLVVSSWPDHRKKPTNHSLHVHYQHAVELNQPGEVLAPPMVLSQVSASWRRIVQSSPHLWATVSVDIYGLGKDIIPLLEIYSKRSANHPLTIEVIDSKWEAEDGFGQRLLVMIEEDGYDPEEVGRDVFLSLADMMPRCEALSLDLPLGLFDEERVPQLSFPFLQSFTCDSTVSPGWLLRAIRQAPQLIDFHGTNQIDRLSTMLPVEQLKSIHLNAFGLDQILSILASCTRLETLEIAETTRDDLHGASVALPFVREFIAHVYEYRPQSTSALLSSLTMPSLSTLKVVTDFPYCLSAEKFPWQPIMDFVNRSTSSLVSLSLSFPGVTLVGGIPSLAHLIRQSPELTTFKLDLGDLPYSASGAEFHSSLSELWARLTVPPSITSSNEVIAPKLKKFHLVITEFREPLSETEFYQELISFAASRSEQSLMTSGMVDIVSPLNELKLETCSSSEILKMQPVIYSATSNEDQVRGLWKQVRELTAGGMACTIEQWGWKR
ncbi:hypothetical protein VNI00_014684 [Paramarasmius palmivorus]|uniref:F-box domain-containing protein n=1 Tax=Paramarasmius palmivorus TaxID=297713 RepID=A0AAW0BRI2_9AGAR